MIRIKQIEGKKQIARTREEPKLDPTEELYHAIDRKFGRLGITTPLDAWLDMGTYASHAVRYVNKGLPVTEVFIAGQLLFVMESVPGREIKMSHYEVLGLAIVEPVSEAVPPVEG